MPTLSKSKLMAYRQCPKRLWLEVHRKDLREDSAATEQGYRTGHAVGEVARQIYDPKAEGILIDAQTEGFEEAFARTQQVLQGDKPVFEAGFKAAGALAFADVLLPVKKGRLVKWRMVEVKSSASVKDYHHDDIAVQGFVAREAGVALESVALAHIDSSWVYKGDGKYQGLLKEKNMDAAVKGRDVEVKEWIAESQKIIASSSEPAIKTGDHCSSPYECGFYDYCSRHEPQATHSVYWLPRVTGDLKKHIAQNGIIEMSDVPDNLLSERQSRVKQATLKNEIFLDSKRSTKALSRQTFPLYFLDFETINPTVPIWKNTSPFQQLPFQFSVHKLGRDGSLTQAEFLEVSGEDPRHALAQALILACGSQGTIYAYNASFEKRCIEGLAKQFPKLKNALMAIHGRVEDLLPIIREYYYHPAMHGSWSIKAVLPTIAPDLDYSTLEGVQDGGMAMDAYAEAIHSSTDVARRETIRQQLLAYCGRDTLAMVRLWEFLSGKSVG